MTSIRTGGIFYDMPHSSSNYFKSSDIFSGRENKSNNKGLRCFSRNRRSEFSTYTISNIPGLNPNIINNTSIGNTSPTKKLPTSTEYLKLAVQDGRKDLLHHEEFKKGTQTRSFQIFQHDDDDMDKENTQQVNVAVVKKTANENNKLKIDDIEIPFVDQLVRNADPKKVTRPELLPVDEKTKLYFAYNRNDGNTSRSRSISPRPFRFGGK